MLLEVDEALVGVDHLLEVDVVGGDMGERVLGIVVGVELGELLDGHLVLDHDGAEDAAGEVATVGHEVDVGPEAALELLQRLAYLGQVLMHEGLVDAHIVVAPAEGGLRRGLVTRTRAADDGVDVDVVGEHEVLGQGEQAQGDAGGEVAGVGHEAALADGAAIELGETIDKLLVVALEAVVAREVDDLEPLGDHGGLHKLTALLG